jgi:hypothetical protein
LNQRPPPCQGGALPTELRDHKRRYVIENIFHVFLEKEVFHKYFIKNVQNYTHIFIK